MIRPAWSVRRLHAVDDAQIEGLAEVLVDCVEGGASPRGGLCSTTVYYRNLGGS